MGRMLNKLLKNIEEKVLQQVKTDMSGLKDTLSEYKSEDIDRLVEAALKLRELPESKKWDAEQILVGLNGRRSEYDFLLRIMDSDEYMNLPRLLDQFLLSACADIMKCGFLQVVRFKVQNTWHNGQPFGTPHCLYFLNSDETLSREAANKYASHRTQLIDSRVIEAKKASFSDLGQFAQVLETIATGGNYKESCFNEKLVSKIDEIMSEQLVDWLQ